MASYTNERQFALSVFGSLLDDAIGWIHSNMEIDEVFDVHQIHSFVQNTAAPADIFDEDELDEWALENGYEKTTTTNK